MYIYLTIFNEILIACKCICSISNSFQVKQWNWFLLYHAQSFLVAICQETEKEFSPVLIWYQKKKKKHHVPPICVIVIWFLQETIMSGWYIKCWQKPVTCGSNKFLSLKTGLFLQFFFLFNQYHIACLHWKRIHHQSVCFSSEPLV